MSPKKTVKKSVTKKPVKLKTTFKIPKSILPEVKALFSEAEAFGKQMSEIKNKMMIARAKMWEVIETKIPPGDCRKATIDTDKWEISHSNEMSMSEMMKQMFQN